jgi:hypothetical protein
MAFVGLLVLADGVSAISIHDETDVFGYVALL